MDRTNQDQHFDAEYIDKLFSSHTRTPVKLEPEPVEAPVPPPVEVIPEEPKEVPAPPAKRPGIAYFLLTAIVCLLLGFLVGRLTAPKHTLDPDATISTTPPSTVIIIHPHPGNTDAPGIAVDYAAMSTQELVDIATQITGLSYYGTPGSDHDLSPDYYRTLKRQNPVLAELEQRPDAVEALNAHRIYTGSLTISYSAAALITFYTTYYNFDAPDDETSRFANQWTLVLDAYTAIYEYTEAPAVSSSYIYGGTNEGPCTVFDFGGIVFTLRGPKSWPEGEPNFWFRIELQQNASQILAADPEPRLAYDKVNGTWVKIQPYESGWFVYGHASKMTPITFTFSPQPDADSLHIVDLTAFPTYDSFTTRGITEDLLGCTSILTNIQANNPGRELSYYPPVAALLSRQDCISTLLKLSLLRDSIPPLLYQSFIQERMTDAESAALHIIQFRTGYISATKLPGTAIVETPEGLVLNGMGDFVLGKTPVNLQQMPLSEMNCWVFVPLSEGAQVLQQGSWSLEIKQTGNDTLGTWDIYDNNTGKRIGWIVSGKLSEDQSVWMQLKQGNILLEKLDLPT